MLTLCRYERVLLLVPVDEVGVDVVRRRVIIDHGQEDSRMVVTQYVSVPVLGLILLQPEGTEKNHN